MYLEIEKNVGEDIKLEVVLHNKYTEKLKVYVAASIIPHGEIAACWTEYLYDIELEPCTKKTVEMTLKTKDCSEGDHDLHIQVAEHETAEILGEAYYENVIHLKKPKKEVEIVDYELE